MYYMFLVIAICPKPIVSYVDGFGSFRSNHTICSDVGHFLAPGRSTKGRRPEKKGLSIPIANRHRRGHYTVVQAGLTQFSAVIS
jgi:hypothetical protein